MNKTIRTVRCRLRFEEHKIPLNVDQQRAKTKALWKAEYSDYRIFAKFGTRFFPYSVFRQNRILRNTKHMAKLTKINFFWPKMGPGSKNIHFWPKSPYSEFSVYTEYSEYVLFCIYRIYRVKIKFIFLQKTCSDSNFNQKFDYDFATQGLSWNPLKWTPLLSVEAHTT